QGYWTEPHDAQLGYTVPNLRTEYAMRNTHVPVGPWRGVNTNQNGLYLECFMEEVAAAAGRDPLEFRRALMQKHPKHLAVLNAAADKAGWGKPLPAGVHRGLAQFMGYASYTAAVAEVSVKGEEVKVLRLVLATNCGHAVNPDQIAAQVEGSVAYGFDTLQSQSSVANGRMVETNFDRYPIARLRQLPRIETVMAPYRGAGSTLDADESFANAVDVIRYIPRAVQIGFFAPFPNQWFEPGTSTGGSIMRRVAAVEMTVIYLTILLGLPLAVSLWWKTPWFWLTMGFCFLIVVTDAYAIPNVGTLYRLRYGFLMTIAGFGLAAILTYAERARAQRELSVQE
ncbi:MAG: xanthine dehydrogenase family protein molybdopterin-binding subunit, partial [Betaproteobacteria bacterium]|nr:xanthine dehydrogenase family protein molybdopterin-binding subunit [Betaproteobacteria bacterium]